MLRPHGIAALVVGAYKMFGIVILDEEVGSRCVSGLSHDLHFLRGSTCPLLDVYSCKAHSRYGLENQKPLINPGYLDTLALVKKQQILTLHQVSANSLSV